MQMLNMEIPRMFAACLYMAEIAAIIAVFAQ